MARCRHGVLNEFPCIDCGREKRMDKTILGIIRAMVVRLLDAENETDVAALNEIDRISGAAMKEVVGLVKSELPVDGRGKPIIYGEETTHEFARRCLRTFDHISGLTLPTYSKVRIEVIEPKRETSTGLKET